MQILMMILCLILVEPLAHARLISTASTSLNIQVYEGSSLDRPFRVIGKVMVRANRAEDLKREIARLAKRDGGDAVLKFQIVKYDQTDIGGITDPKGKTVYGIGTFQQAAAEGVIVRFVNQDGITEITDDTPVPILD